MKHAWRIDRLLKNANILKSGIGQNPTTALYNETTQTESFFDKEKTFKNAKITKRTITCL